MDGTAAPSDSIIPVGGASTVGDALADASGVLRAAGIEGARHEALLLLAHAAGARRETLLAFPERPLGSDAALRYVELVARRAAREPYAYLIGEREFYGRSFLVDRRVLVPRPETETLVEAALEILNARAARADSGATSVGRSASGQAHSDRSDLGDAHSDRPALGRADPGRSVSGRPLVVDIGTGSGAIALTVAAEASAARVVACDVSADALAVAARNRERLGLAGVVDLVRGDLLTWLGTPADLVLANLPYLPTGRLPELMPEVAAYEPPLALFAGDDGFGLIRRLLDDARRAIRPGGSLLLELDPEQVAAVHEVAAWADVSVLRDLMGNERVVRLDMP